MSRLPDRFVQPLSPAMRTRGLAVAVVFALLGYATFVFTEANIAPAGADSSGYFNLARMLLERRIHAAPRVIEGVPMAEVPYFTYAPLGFVPDVIAGHITPTYPPGLPLLLAASASIGGWHWGPQGLMLLHALAGVGLTFALARMAGVSRPVGCLVAAALALSPLYLAYCLQAMSDLPALVWCALALLLATRAGGASALGCGMALGLAVLIRPTNAMLALPIALALGRPDRRWLWVAAGGVPAAVFMALLNRAAYGNLFATGYGDVSEFFGLKWVGVSTAHYARWLPVVLTPLFLVALAAPWHRSVPRRLLWSHAAWVAASATFYSFYYFTHREWWYLRFLLPSLPSLLVLAGLGAEALVAHLRSPLVRRALWGAAAISIAVNANLRWHSLGLRGIGQTGARFTEMHQFIAESVPANAVVLSLEGSGTLFFSTNLCIVRWDTLDDAWPRVRDGALRAGRPLYATLFTFEDEQRFRERTPGNWEFVAQHGLATLWRLKPSP